MNDNSGNSRRPTEPKKGPSNGQNFIWYLIPIAAAAFIVSMFFVNNAAHEISYYDFLRLIEVSRLDEQGKPVSKTPYVIVKTVGRRGASQIDPLSANCGICETACRPSAAWWTLKTSANRPPRQPAPSRAARSCQPRRTTQGRGVSRR